MYTHTCIISLSLSIHIVCTQPIMGQHGPSLAISDCPTPPA